MAVHRTVESLNRAIRKKLKNVERGAAASTRDAAIFIRYKAQLFAPKRTGHYASAITVRHYKNASEVTSSPSSEALMRGFNEQALFIHRLSSYKYTKYNGYFNKGQTVTYGDGSITPSGNPVQWTESAESKKHNGPMYAAFAIGKKYYRARLINAVRNALRS